MIRLFLLHITVILFIADGNARNKEFFHDYYLSLCEIQYNENTHSLEISIRIFNDDLEKAVFEFNKGHIYDLKGKQTPDSNEKIKNYILSRFFLVIDKKHKIVPDFLGWETIEGSVWCYFELKHVVAFKELGVMNSLLTEMFERQKNLIYLKKDNTEKSVVLDKEKTFSTFVL